MESHPNVEFLANDITNLSDSPSLQGPASNACPRCGGSDPAMPNIEDQSRITELQSQVKILTDKATSAVEKLADYEDEIHKLRSSAPNPPQTSEAQSSATVSVSADANGTKSSSSSSLPLPPIINDGTPKALPPTPAPGEGSTLFHRPSVKNRFPSFLTRSNSRSPATAPAAATTPSTRETELAAQLTQERTMREAAESKINQMSSEIEDLSVTLFQQANEMVSTERQARVKLEERAARFEERCGMLEEKVRVLEKRDGEKRKRLDGLEVAVVRIERIRKMLEL